MEQKKAPRKDFRKQSPQFFLIGLVVALSSTLVAFEWRTSEITPLVFPPQPLIEIVDIEPPIRIFTTEAPPLPPPPKVAPVPAPTPAPNPIPVPNPQPQPVVPIPYDSGFTVEPFVPEDKPPVNWVEQMPEFVGGEQAMYQYLGKNLNYPKIALDLNIEAKLYVQFIVNKDGSISDVKVLRPEGYGFDEEAERVVKNMPTWIPGKQAGRKVRVYYVLPINFAIM